MLDGLQQLTDLQVLDAELVSARDEQSEIPALREKRADERSVAQQKFEAATALTQSAEAEQRRVETTLQDQEALVEKLDFSAKDVSPHEPFTFELSAAILGSSDRNVSVSGTVGPVDTTNPAAAWASLCRRTSTTMTTRSRIGIPKWYMSAFRT